MKELDNASEPSDLKACLPPRIAARPDPGQWGDFELLLLPEAAALFFPAGPLTTTSLRNAIKNNRLSYVAIAGKFFTNKVAIAEMSVCRRGTDVSNAGAGDPVAVEDKQQLAVGLHDRLYRKRRKA
jgi:hypothetical protein